MSSVSASGAVFHGPVASASTAVARAAATRARGRDDARRATRGEDAREATARARAGAVDIVVIDIVVVASRRRVPSRVPSRVSTPRRRSSMNDATSSQSVDDRRRDRARGDEGTDRANDMVVSR